MNSNKTAMCLLCGSREFEVIYVYDTPDQYECSVGVDTEGYTRKWVQCSKCSLYYSIYSRPENILDRIYISSYRADSSIWRSTSTEDIFNRVISLLPGESETKFRTNWIKSQIQALWTSNFMKKLVPPCRMLDIGGASGVFAYEFRDKDWLTQVIDPSEDGIFLQKKYGIPYKQEYYKAGIFSEQFDLITLVFVLEHLHDPVSMLREVRKDLGRDSFIYIEVPDAICFRYKTKDDDIFNSCHLWMFNLETLIRLLNLTGFETLSIQRTLTKRGHYSLMMLGGCQ